MSYNILWRAIGNHNMLKAFKYRIYPTEEQKVLLSKHFGCVRYIYNQGLQKKIETYQQTGKSISSNNLTTGMLKELKDDPNKEWLSEVYSQCLQMALRNLDNAFTKFFREKKGFPKFKSKHNNRQSCQFPQNVKINFEDKTIKVPKIGIFETVFSREFEGKVKTTTISKTPTNKYYVSILVDDGKELPIKSKTVEDDKAIGIDLGIKNFAILSNWEKIPNPKYLKKDIERLKVLQRRASKKQKGSQNRKKANLKVALVYEKITNRRDDFLHKLSSKLINENQVICFEDLNVAGMMKNHKLARSIGDASWSKFLDFCNYKADWHGKTIVQIGRFDASSKTCSKCGWIKKDLTLKDREWICDSCRAEHDRDINAANNIKNFGLIRFRMYENYSGPGRTSVPMEMSGSKQNL